MKRTHTIVIGAGQAGLALSHCLTGRGVDHVLLERGRVAQRWTERWDSLRLLTPNWMTRLPGFRYRGADPNGFMTRDALVAFLREYARSFDSPVVEETKVLDVVRRGREWRVITTSGVWYARNVVIATGHNDKARIPSCALRLPSNVHQVSTIDYRNPDQLPEGGVLVVGASASGAQLARELRRSGREVILAAGQHVRVPRRYRGRDIHYWLDRIGVMARPLSDVRDPLAARREPSLQLVGENANLDLGELSKEGVRLAGRLAGIENGRARFADDRASTMADADRRLQKILAKIDLHIAGHGARYPAEAPVRTIEYRDALRELPLRNIATVLWATGYTRSYPWLRAPVLDANGEIRQSRGRTSADGLYVLGVQFMTRRNSSFIDGVGRDAEEIAEAIATSRMERKAA